MTIWNGRNYEEPRQSRGAAAAWEQQRGSSSVGAARATGGVRGGGGEQEGIRAPLYNRDQYDPIFSFQVVLLLFPLYCFDP